jgi:predicted nucleotidyltransferase
MNLVANWNDEVNFRQVQFDVRYSIENSRLSIDSVTPVKVSFLDKANQTLVRSIGVHTSRGQKMLVEQMKASGKLEEISNEIANQAGLMASV